MMKLSTSVVCSLLLLQIAHGCPWCNNSPLQKPTVTPEMGDPGGRFFGKAPPPDKTRHYYIAAEPVMWNFMPKATDPVSQGQVPLRFYTNASIKLRYVQYSDETFTLRASQPPHLGILGPVLRGKTGEFLAVTFLNRTDRPLSMHPHGLKYDKDSEGSSYFPERGLGAAVAPQAKFTYVWHIDSAAGPSPGEPSSKAWLYHSHVLADQEINAGLVGFIVVTDPARARPDGAPKDIDRELATAFLIFDEAAREDDDDLTALPLPDDPSTRARVLQQRTADTIKEIQSMELGARHTVNGLIFGNLDGLEMIEGERVRWYLFALGSERDLHTAHWHGTRVSFNGRTTDVVELLPGSMTVVDFVADNPGQWLFHCHVADHMMEGMYAPFTEHPARSKEIRTDALRENLYSSELPPKTLQIQSAAFESRNGTNFVRLTGLFHISNPPRFHDLPVEFRLDQQHASFRLNSHGKATASDGASVHLSLNRTGIGFGVQMKIELVLPLPPASAFPLPWDRKHGSLSVQVLMDGVLLRGTASLEQ